MGCAPGEVEINDYRWVCPQCGKVNYATREYISERSGFVECMKCGTSSPVYSCYNMSLNELKIKKPKRYQKVMQEKERKKLEKEASKKFISDCKENLKDCIFNK